MYKRFYQLTRNPFDLSPDPSFYYPTPAHNEALASLYYGISHRRGFIVLTGEVGTGKTLVTRYLMRELARHSVSFAYVFNPVLSATEFLQYVGREFGRADAGSKALLLHDLNNHLLDVYENKQIAALVIDEAQDLTPELLEEIRLLSNLETLTQKLLQIVLVGQPELEQKLDRYELRQLKQRVALRCRLMPLNEAQTRAYIYSRLQWAGAPDGARIFPPLVVNEVYKLSGGIPRIINVLCENALICSFAARSPQVNLDHLRETAKDFLIVEGGMPSPPVHRLPEAGDQTERAAMEYLLTRMLDAVGTKPPRRPTCAGSRPDGKGSE
jgi:general secretion pathway protein A